VPLSGSSAASFLPPSGAPSPSATGPLRAYPFRPPPAPRSEDDGIACGSGQQLGQQCCPMLNMAKTGRKHKGSLHNSVPARRERRGRTELRAAEATLGGSVFRHALRREWTTGPGRAQRKTLRSGRRAQSKMARAQS